MPFYCKRDDVDIDWMAVVEALEWTGANWDEMCCFIPVPSIAHGEAYPCDAHMDIIIMTPNGEQTAHLGDYIIRDGPSEFRPCPPDVFARTYERFIFERIKPHASVTVMDGGE